jgi:hypothetical protein
MRRFMACSVLAGLWLAGCTGTGPSTPDNEEPGAGMSALASHAFQLTIDMGTGRIDVVQPKDVSAARGSKVGPSFSLIGSDGVRMSAGGCRFTSIPNNPRLKRCTFRLEIENSLGATDLLTPTDFPHLPAGTTGVLVFPFSASARGSVSPTAVPSPDWDRPPVNFFNDTGSCSSGNKSDCYRYEIFGSPLYARESEERMVGFDVPVDATSVTAYIVVAADLRDNPVRTFNLTPVDELCGVVSTSGEVITNPEGMLIGAQLIGSEIVVSRTFCSWLNPEPFRDVRVRTALVRVYNGRPDLSGYPYVEYLPYGTTLDVDDFGLPAIAESHEMRVSEDWRLARLSVQFEGSVREEVQQAADAHTSSFQFRIRAKNEGDTFNAFYGIHHPILGTELELTYTLK